MFRILFCSNVRLSFPFIGRYFWVIIATNLWHIFVCHLQENIYGRLYPSPQDNFFALLRSYKIIYQGIEDIHRIHIMTVKRKKYLNKVIYNASLSGWLYLSYVQKTQKPWRISPFRCSARRINNRWIYLSIAWEGLKYLHSSESKKESIWRCFEGQNLGRTSKWM